MAREVGFKNINVDLMLALPGQTVPKLKQGLKQIIALKPEHISLYSLILEEGTVLNKKVQNKEIELPDEDDERKMYWETKRILEEAGYIHYEISNFAKKDMNLNIIQTVGTKKNIWALERLHIHIQTM